VAADSRERALKKAHPKVLALFRLYPRTRTIGSFLRGQAPKDFRLSRVKVRALHFLLKSMQIKSPRCTCSVAASSPRIHMCRSIARFRCRAPYRWSVPSATENPRRTRHAKQELPRAVSSTRCCTVQLDLQHSSVASAAMDEKPQPCPTGS